MLVYVCIAIPKRTLYAIKINIRTRQNSYKAKGFSGKTERS